jgi:hypothetical protein
MLAIPITSEPGLRGEALAPEALVGWVTAAA